MASYNIEEIGGEAKSLHSEKLNLVNFDLCPYQIPANFRKNDPTKWLALEYPDIYHYLVEIPGVFTRESMKNRKSLETHNQGMVKDSVPLPENWIQFCYFES